MRVAIRADASVTLGSGHVARCLVLARALRARGASVTFLGQVLPGSMEDEIRRQGFSSVVLPAGVPADEDAARCKAALAEDVDLLVVDHYGLDAVWERAMRSRAQVLLAIDDLADRTHECDVLLDQNLAADPEGRYRGKLPGHCRCLLEPRHALLGEEFVRLAPQAALRTGALRRILIFFGGGDPDGLTGRALAELDAVDPALAGDVVIGAANPRREALAALCAASGGRWRLHVQTGHMAELMAAADLALGAGGFSHWERCAMALPALVVTVADNQVAATRILHERGACQWLGDAATLQGAPFAQAVRALRAAPEALRAMSRAAHEIVPEGGGVARVLAALAQLPPLAALDSPSDDIDGRIPR